MAIEKPKSQTQPTGQGRCLAHHTGPHCAVHLVPKKPKQSGIFESSDDRSEDCLAITKGSLDDESKHAIISRVENLINSGFPNEPFAPFFQSPRNQIVVIDSLEYQCKGAGEDGTYLKVRDIRDHYRLLLTPHRVNVTKFESSRELISVFTDYAESEDFESFTSWSIR